MNDDWIWKSDEIDAGMQATIQTWLVEGSTRPAVRRSIESLLEEMARLRSVLGHCPRGIAVLDEAGNLVGFNRELAKLLSTVPTLGEPLDAHFAASDREILAEVVRCAGTDRRSAGVMRSNQGDRDIEFFAATLPGNGEASIGVILAGEDRTSWLREDGERALIDAANQDSAFRVAAMVLRHEVGAMLAVADRALHAPAPTTTGIEHCQEAIRQALAILDRRSALPNPMPQARAAHVADAARLAARFALVGAGRRRVLVNVDAADDLCVAMAERQLMQLLTNLATRAVRAVEARSGVGTVEIAAATDADGGISIRVRDDGVGIEPSELQTIFDPDETRIGLSIAKLLVDMNGGQIRAVSDPERGTTISVMLPAALGST